MGKLKQNGEGVRYTFTVCKNRSWRLGLLPGDPGLHPGVAAGEFLDATCGINELLFSGEKRMAGGADTDLQVAAGGTGVEHGPTGARDGGLGIIWVNICFHGFKRAGHTSALDRACNQKTILKRFSWTHFRNFIV